MHQKLVFRKMLIDVKAQASRTELELARWEMLRQSLADELAGFCFEADGQHVPPTVPVQPPAVVAGPSTELDTGGQTRRHRMLSVGNRDGANTLLQQKSYRTGGALREGFYNLHFRQEGVVVGRVYIGSVSLSNVSRLYEVQEWQAFCRTSFYSREKW